MHVADVGAGVTSGDRAWVGLLLYVACYDWWAHRTGRDTLSQSYGRALDSPRRRAPTVAVWAYLTAHLTRKIPDKLDPLRRIGGRG